MSIFPTYLASPGHCPFTEAVRLPDPGLHQTLHWSQLATEARQGSLCQRPSGEGRQGNNSMLEVQLRAGYSNLSGQELQKALKKPFMCLCIRSEYVRSGCGGAAPRWRPEEVAVD